jgi:hypothetical protein
MGDLTPSRIDPLGEAPENRHDTPSRRPVVKKKASDTPAPVPPPVETEKEEDHQLDELA